MAVDCCQSRAPHVGPHNIDGQKWCSSITRVGQPNPKRLWRRERRASFELLSKTQARGRGNCGTYRASTTGDDTIERQGIGNASSSVRAPRADGFSYGRRLLRSVHGITGGIDVGWTAIGDGVHHGGWSVLRPTDTTRGAFER